MRTAPSRERLSRQSLSERRPSVLRRRLLGLAAAVAGVLLAASAHRVPHYPVDVAIAHSVQMVSGAWFHTPLDVLSALGFPPLVIIFDSLVMVLVLAFWGRWAAFSCGFAALLAPAVQHLVKTVVARPRPPSTLVHVARDIPNPAFPAGHVLDITAFLGFVCYLAHSRLEPSPCRAALVGLPLASIVLMGLARIDAGAHWASDVLGGYLFGVACLVLTIEVYTWGGRWKRRNGSSGHPQLARGPDQSTSV